MNEVIRNVYTRYATSCARAGRRRGAVRAGRGGGDRSVPPRGSNSSGTRGARAREGGGGARTSQRSATAPETMVAAAAANAYWNHHVM